MGLWGISNARCKSPGDGLGLMVIAGDDGRGMGACQLSGETNSQIPGLFSVTGVVNAGGGMGTMGLSLEKQS